MQINWSSVGYVKIHYLFLKISFSFGAYYCTDLKILSWSTCYTVVFLQCWYIKNRWAIAMLCVLSLLCGPYTLQNTNKRFIKKEHKIAVCTQGSFTSERSQWNPFKLMPLSRKFKANQKLFCAFIYQSHSPGVKNIINSCKLYLICCLCDKTFQSLPWESRCIKWCLKIMKNQYCRYLKKNHKFLKINGNEWHWSI